MYYPNVVQSTAVAVHNLFIPVCSLTIEFFREIRMLFSPSRRFNQRKNDTVNIQLGPLCNYQSVQANDDLGRIRLGKSSILSQHERHLLSGILQVFTSRWNKHLAMDYRAMSIWTFRIHR